MSDIPKEFRKLPEADRLRRADAEFSAAIEEQRQSIGQLGDHARQVNERVRRSQEELHRAQLAFDAATGEPRPVGLTPAVLAEIQRQFPAEQQQEVIALLDQSCGRNLPLMRDATAEKLEHIRLCALIVGKGDLPQLRLAVEEAKRDWRDLICAAGSPLPRQEQQQADIPPRRSRLIQATPWCYAGLVLVSTLIYVIWRLTR